MVSMRVLRNKFTEGEKVLCYEPDPAKTKVLYDSKVLDIVSRKDENGKKILEFLIHFQGWNSTWDRFVTEDFVLKDTEENRKLQRELAAKAQLTAGCGNLYRKERKKRPSTVGGGTSTGNKGSRDWSSRSSAGGGESGSGSRGSSGTSVETSGPAVASTSNRRNFTAGAEEKSDDDGPKVVINFIISPKMRFILESDFAKVKQQNKVVKLPCSPNINEILQMWLTEYILSRIRLMCHKKGQVKPIPQNKPNNFTIEHIYTHANLCHEVADGLRIYIDFMLKTLLLYDEERIQFRCYIPPDECKIKAEETKMDVDEKRIEREEKSTDHHLRFPLARDKNTVKHTKEKLQKESHFKEKQTKESPARDKTPKEHIKERLCKDSTKEKLSKDKAEDTKKELLMFTEVQSSSPSRNDQDRRKSLRPRGQMGEILPTNPTPVSTVVGTPSSANVKAEKSLSASGSSNQQNIVNDKRAALRGKTRSSLGRSSSLHGAIDITELFGPEANKGPEPLFLRPMSRQEKEWLKRIVDRKLFPDSYCPILKPSATYGAIHLARVLMKVPDLMAAADYGDAKVTLLSELLKHLMLFLEEHQEWYSEEMYIQNSFNSTDMIPQFLDEQMKKSSVTKLKNYPPPPIVNHKSHSNSEKNPTNCNTTHTVFSAEFSV